MSHSPSNHCLNCDHRLAPWDRYCSQCGQHARVHAPTLWEFVHEWVLHYLALEGALWRSLWKLMAQPGALTLDYWAGRRRRYIEPLRLVLTLGLLFFVAVKFAPSGDTPAWQVDGPPGVASTPALTAPRASSPAQPPAAASGPNRLNIDLPAGTPAWLASRFTQRMAALERDPEAELQRIGRSVLALAPYAVLASIPFYAGLLSLLHGRRRSYGEHFVFAMHLHAFWYGCLLLALLPVPGASLLAWAWSNLYPVLALRRVYGGAWTAVLARAAGLAGLHLLLLGLTGLTLLMAGALGA